MSPKRKTCFYIGIIVVSWILILAISPLRQMFFAQTILGGYTSTIQYYALPAIIPRAAPYFSKLAKEHPTLLSLQLQKFEDEEFQITGAEVDKEFGKSDVKKPAVNRQTLQQQYEELPNQFPHSLLALACSLNNSFKYMKTIRRGGPLTDPDSYEKRKKGIPSADHDGQRNYTQQQWQQVIERCREGQKLDPRNAYFDMVEAYWQFAELHDDAAWAAIQRAATKPVFNIYETDAYQDNLQAYQIAFGRPLYWEEIENNVISGWGASGSLYESMREMARWIEWEGIKAQLHGNNEKALKIYDELFQVAHVWEQTSTSLIGRMVADAIQDLALSGPSGAGVKPDPNTKQQEIYFTAFKNYALSIHRPDQLRYVEIARADYKNQREQVTLMEREEQPYLAGAFAGYLLWRAGILLLLLLSGCVLTWLLTAASLKVLLRKKIQRLADINEGEYWRGALSFAAFPASIILIIGYGFLAYREMIPKSRPLFYDDMVSLHFLSDSSIAPWWLFILGILTPVIFGLGYLLRRAAMKNQNSGTPKVLLWKRILSIIGSLLFVIFWATLASGQLPFPFDLHSVDTTLTTIIFNIPEMGYRYDLYVTLGLAAFCVIVGLIIYFINTIRIWRKVDDRESALMMFRPLLHGSALRWLALGSVLYMLMLAIAVPVRRPLQERELKKVAQGETVGFKAGR